MNQFRQWRLRVDMYVWEGIVGMKEIFHQLSAFFSLGRDCFELFSRRSRCSFMMHFSMATLGLSHAPKIFLRATKINITILYH